MNSFWQEARNKIPQIIETGGVPELEIRVSIEKRDKFLGYFDLAPEAGAV